MRLALFLTVLLGLLAPRAARAEPTVALTYFDNNTGDPAFDPLGRGLADMLITDLSALSSLKIVERSRLNEVLSELELAASPFIDASTAATLGRGLGATLIVTGSFAAVEPDLRIDARLVDVATGEVVLATAVTGPKAEFFLLEKELALAIAEQAGASVSFREQARLGRVATESFGAFSAWSSSLEAMDRGSIEEAKEALDKALDSDASFASAQAMLKDIESRIETYRGQRKELLASREGDVYARMDAIAKAGGPYEELVELVDPFGVFTDMMRAPEAQEVAGRVLEMGIPESIELALLPSKKLPLNEWAVYVYHYAAGLRGQRAEALAYGETYLERYPAGMYAPGIANVLKGIKGQIERERAGKLEVPRLRAEAERRTHESRCRLRPGSHRDGFASKQLPACRAWIESFKEDDPEHKDLPRAVEENAERAKEAGNRERLVQLQTRFPEVSEIGTELERLDRWRAEADKATASLHEVLPAAGQPIDSGSLRSIWHRIEDLSEKLLQVNRLDEAAGRLARGLELWPNSLVLRELDFELAERRMDPEGMEAAFTELRRAHEARFAEDQAELRCKLERAPQRRAEACRDWLNREVLRRNPGGALKPAINALGRAGEREGLLEVQGQYPSLESKGLQKELDGLEKHRTRLAQARKAAGGKRLKPKTAAEAENLAWRLLDKAREWDEAARLLAGAVKRWPEHSDLWVASVELQLELGDADAADQALAKARETWIAREAGETPRGSETPLGEEEAAARWARSKWGRTKRIGELREDLEKLAILPVAMEGDLPSKWKRDFKDAFSWQKSLKAKKHESRIAAVRDFPTAWAEAEFESLVKLAKELAGKAQHAEAAELYLRLVRDYPASEDARHSPARLQYDAGSAFKKAGQNGRTVDTWEDLIARFPDSPQATAAATMLTITPR